jgi:hypothetical protein
MSKGATESTRFTGPPVDIVEIFLPEFNEDTPPQGGAATNIPRRSGLAT